MILPEHMRIGANVPNVKIPLARSDFRYNGSERVLRKKLNIKMCIND